MRVEYIGENLVAMIKGKVYEVISVEGDYYRIMTEIGEDYLFHKRLFKAAV